MGRKAIQKRDNQLIINIDEIEREQQALMLTKSNDLIHAKFNASLFVQKLLNFSLASIAKQPNGEISSAVRVADLRNAMDLSGHSIYTAVSAAVEPILNFKIIKYDDAAEKIIGLNIVTDCYYSDGILYTTFNRKIEADVINIQKKFTRNNVYFLCKFKSAYSLRLYELLSTQRWVLQKSKKKIVSVIYSLGELRFEMGTIDPNDSEVQKAMRRNMDWNIIAEEVAANRTQKRWDDFKRRILVVAQKEINNADYSDIGFDFEPVKSGKSNKVTSVKFHIYLKNPPKYNDQMIPEEEIDAVDVRLVSDIKNAFPSYPLREEDLIAVVRAAGNDRDRVRKAIDIVNIQKKPIKNLIGFLVAAIQECWDQDENIPYIVDQDYECTQQTIFDYNEHEEEHQRLNELVKKYLANDIEETDIKMEDRSVVKAMANASKKVEKMKTRDIM